MSARRYPPGKLPHDELRRLISRFAGHHERLVVPPQVGEDAAVIDMGDRYLVAKTDPITFATDRIGWYAVHVNANDIATMGARPLFFMATILLPDRADNAAVAEAIFSAIHAAAMDLDIVVCGGHTEITHGLERPIVVGNMLGEMEPDRLIRSSGLRPGHVLLLTKGLAIEATALIARERRDDLLTRGHGAETLARCEAYLEDPGISVVVDAQTATSAGTVSAMHDPTEGGVATGLIELAQASEVGMEIDAASLYVAEDSRRLCAEFDLEPLGIISSGALLIGCEPDSAAPILGALKEAGIRADRIGVIREKEFGVLMRRAGELEELPVFAVDEITRLFAD